MTVLQCLWYFRCIINNITYMWRLGSSSSLSSSPSVSSLWMLITLGAGLGVSAIKTVTSRCWLERSIRFLPTVTSSLRQVNSASTLLTSMFRASDRMVSTWGSSLCTPACANTLAILKVRQGWMLLGLERFLWKDRRNTVRLVNRL